jgi:ubiquinone/menaquinone biosynthesis C-methylase UbiE
MMEMMKKMLPPSTFAVPVALTLVNSFVSPMQLQRCGSTSPILILVTTLIVISFRTASSAHAFTIKHHPNPITSEVSSSRETTGMHNNNANTDAVFDAIKVEYKQMASWYDTFWHSYTLGMCLLLLLLLLLVECHSRRHSNEVYILFILPSSFTVRMYYNTETLKKPLSQVVQLGGANANVVDVGCGTGEFLRRLHQTCLPITNNNLNNNNLSKPKWIGVEPSKEMLDEAQKKFDPTNSLVDLKQAPAERLPIEDSTADLVVSTNAFHFFRDKQRALGEIKRIMKKNGTLIITDWCNDYWIVKFYHWLERVRWNWRFQDRYPGPQSKSELVKLVQIAGFGNIQSEKYRVRVFWIFFWGMQTISAQKID